MCQTFQNFQTVYKFENQKQTMSHPLPPSNTRLKTLLKTIINVRRSKVKSKDAQNWFLLEQNKSA